MVAGEMERVSWGAGVQGEPVRFADRWDMEKRNRRSKDDSRVLPMALVLAFCLFACFIGVSTKMELSEEVFRRKNRLCNVLVPSYSISLI